MVSILGNLREWSLTIDLPAFVYSVQKIDAGESDYDLLRTIAACMWVSTSGNCKSHRLTIQNNCLP